MVLNHFTIIIITTTIIIIIKIIAITAKITDSFLIMLLFFCTLLKV